MRINAIGIGAVDFADRSEDFGQVRLVVRQETSEPVQRRVQCDPHGRTSSDLFALLIPEPGRGFIAPRIENAGHRHIGIGRESPGSPVPVPRLFDVGAGDPANFVEAAERFNNLVGGS
jgi:hypothetical protein